MEARSGVPIGSEKEDRVGLWSRLGGKVSALSDEYGQLVVDRMLTRRQCMKTCERGHGRDLTRHGLFALIFVGAVIVATLIA